MKVLKITGIITGGLFSIVIFLVILLPSHSHVERSVTINATPARVFVALNSFKSFNTWSPWAALDPHTKYQYTGPEAGVGACMRWQSENDEVGNGSQKIIEIVENKRVKNEMSFEGFDTKSYAEFNLTPAHEGTRVTWAYDGEMSGVWKIFGLMMDGTLGPVFERGLAKLKAVVESKKDEVPATTITAADSLMSKR